MVVSERVTKGGGRVLLTWVVLHIVVGGSGGGLLLSAAVIDDGVVVVGRKACDVASSNKRPDLERRGPLGPDVGISRINLNGL